MFRRRAAPLLKTEAQDSKARSWLHDRPGSLASVGHAGRRAQGGCHSDLANEGRRRRKRNPGAAAKSEKRNCDHEHDILREL
jgi:hypothetical protein